MKKIFSIGMAVVSMALLLFSCSAFDEEQGSGFYCSFCEDSYDSYVGYSSSSDYWYSNISSSISYWYSSTLSEEEPDLPREEQSSSSSSIVSNCNDLTFKTVLIGDQTWMAENLNCNVSGSKCYGDNNSNCATYGRLYDWATAMDLPSDCNNNISCSEKIQDKHKGICPKGWYIPSNEDWATLVNYIETTDGKGFYTAGRYLKATSGWYSCDPYGYSYLCEDSYGFAALPGGGYFDSDGIFFGVGDYGFWWSASEYSASYAYYQIMYYSRELVGTISNDKSSLVSVRCLQD